MKKSDVAKVRRMLTKWLFKSLCATLTLHLGQLFWSVMIQICSSCKFIMSSQQMNLFNLALVRSTMYMSFKKRQIRRLENMYVLLMHYQDVIHAEHAIVSIYFYQVMLVMMIFFLFQIYLYRMNTFSKAVLQYGPVKNNDKGYSKMIKTCTSQTT